MGGTNVIADTDLEDMLRYTIVIEVDTPTLYTKRAYICPRLVDGLLTLCGKFFFDIKTLPASVAVYEIYYTLEYISV